MTGEGKNGEVSDSGRESLILILSGEYSGSLYGSIVARRIKDLSPGTRLLGVGGHHMEEAGVELLFDSSTWGGIGLVEALKRFPRLSYVYLRLKRVLNRTRPDLVILIDYPGFNMQIARVAKSLGIPTLYYFPPGKYRCPPEAVRDAASTVTRVAAPFQMAFERYSQLNAHVDFVGHPLLDVVPERIDAAAIRAELSVTPSDTVIGLLPGSRFAELELHTPRLCRAARVLHDADPSLKFFMPVVSYRNQELTDRVLRLIDQEIKASGAPVQILPEQAHKVMAISRLVLVCSGTATLEATYFQTPMVIVYRVSKLTEMLASLFYSIPFKFVGLPNILADRPIVPELVQDEFTVENVVRTAQEILRSKERDLQIRSELKSLIPLMGDKGASHRVARMALEMIASPALARVDASRPNTTMASKGRDPS